VFAGISRKTSAHEPAGGRSALASGWRREARTAFYPQPLNIGGGLMLLGEQRGVDEILVSLEARYPSGEEQTEPEEWAAFDYLPSHGMWIALATFVPTFLAVVIGVPYVLTSLLAPQTIEPRVPVAPRSATPALTASATPTGWPAELRPVFVATSGPSGMEETSRPKTLVDEAPTPQPGLETAKLAASQPTAIRPKAPKPAPAEDSAWAPAAAFADNQSAARLASTMRNQGYRVDVRHEDAATRPWVVWIKANPQKPKGG